MEQKSAQLACPVCSAKSVPDGHSQDADLFRCPDCDHCFSDVGSIRQVETYDESYFEEVHRNWFANPDVGLFEGLGRIIAGHREDASVIDLGCGNGNFVKFLRQKYPRLVLTAVDGTAPFSVTPGIHFIQGDIFDAKISGRFDVVAALDVIEHMPDLSSFLERVDELCAPGGMIILKTINERSTLYGVARFLRAIRYRSPFDRLYSSHHLNHFNISSLRRLVEANGLSVSKTLRHNVPLSALDMGAGSWFGKRILRIGVWGTFTVGVLTGTTYQQTIVCRKNGAGHSERAVGKAAAG
jgi:2-polyprenyl-3-methyl-5-hydroxy-6-metoxy-1,4-benzoquinol methylase